MFYWMTIKDVLNFAGAVIYTVNAKDEDRSSPNNLVAYSLLSGDFQHFSIEPETGNIKVIDQLDKEGERSEYSLVVAATDGGLPSQTTQQTIVVKVIVMRSSVTYALPLSTCACSVAQW